MKAAQSRVSGALSLRDFVHKSKVLSQYRSFLRELRHVDAALRQDLRTQVRTAYRAKVSEASAPARRALLADGQRQLQDLQKYTGVARTAREAAGGVDKLPANTWVGTGEAYDIRGRVGEGFPWGSKT